jgi:hypothetical protein
MIPQYSFMWSWIVTLFSQIVLTWMWYHYTRKIIKFHIPFNYIIKNIFIWAFMYWLWYFLLNNYKFWLYIDFIVYGWILFTMYACILFYEFKKERIKSLI